MDLLEVMRTTFSARQFTDQPVSNATIYRLLEDARFAPSGGNRQGWRVIVVRDPEVRAQLRDWSEPAMRRYLAQVAAGENPWNTIQPTQLSEAEFAAAPRADAIVAPVTDAAVLLVLCADLRVLAALDQTLDRIGMVSGASIYPFAHNILLAARNQGLGGVITTYVSPQEADAQRLLGLPPHIAVAALIPLGRPVKQLTKLRRNPVEDFAVLERWGGLALTPDS